MFILYIKPADKGLEVLIRKKGCSVEITLHTAETLKQAKEMLEMYKAFFECGSVFD